MEIDKILNRKTDYTYIILWFSLKLLLIILSISSAKEAFFRTIFVVSIFYAMGQVILAGSSVASAGAGVHPWLDLAAFAIIGLGTGGIKAMLFNIL